MNCNHITTLAVEAQTQFRIQDKFLPFWPLLSNRHTDGTEWNSLSTALLMRIARGQGVSQDTNSMFRMKDTASLCGPTPA